VSKPGTAREGGLDRTLGLWQVTASGVGIIVGAGIYVLVGDAVALAGARTWMAFVLAAGLSLLTGLSYAELTSMYPKAGAEFEYASPAPHWRSAGSPSCRSQDWWRWS
jgi:APA family basic amino acid/polyamine antiporter